MFIRWTRARWAGPSPSLILLKVDLSLDLQHNTINPKPSSWPPPPLLSISRRRRRRAPPPPPLFAGKFVPANLDEESPSAPISSGLLVQADEGIPSPVVDLIDVVYRNLPMQIDNDLVIYRTTLVRTFQVVTIRRVDKSEAAGLGETPMHVGVFFEENPSTLISSGLLVQADEGVSLPVVDLIDESTAAYREEPLFLIVLNVSRPNFILPLPRRETGSGSATVPQQVVRQICSADEGVSLPVVDLIDESTAAYREEPVFLRINFESGIPTSAIDLQVLDLLSESHHVALINLLEKLRQHKLKWTQPSTSNLLGRADEQGNGIYSQFYPSVSSTSWKKQLPQKPFVDAFAPICVFIEPVQDIDSRRPYSTIFKRKWVEIYTDVIQFSLSGHLQSIWEESALSWYAWFSYRVRLSPWNRSGELEYFCGNRSDVSVGQCWVFALSCGDEIWYRRCSVVR
ncbi:hypothetical protein F511_34421 [Dorcoceras hygrometricum]|uniref:Uncharacterized protein n=1 Tax=Dorcoceras hygrometricum TaxID=472368 RepID=A0A2Z7B3Q6_9LAMI|nr:hypothetical protein F511_34421 [Dorcoceras hygrometricum]